MSNRVQCILNAKGVQKVFMHLRFYKLTCCEATSLTAYRRLGAVPRVRVCVCILNKLVDYFKLFIFLIVSY